MVVVAAIWVALVVAEMEVEVRVAEVTAEVALAEVGTVEEMVDPGALRIAEAPCRGTTCWGEQGEERRSHHGGPGGTREFTGRRIH